MRACVVLVMGASVWLRGRVAWTLSWSHTKAGQSDYRTFQPDVGAAEAAIEDRSEEKEAEEFVALRWNYYWATFYFSIAQGFSNVAVCMASSLMNERVAVTGDGLFYATAAFMSLVVAAPLMTVLGLRGTTVYGCVGVVIYLTGFAIALGTNGSVTGDVFWYIASIFGGMGRCTCWTAQGAYMGATAVAMVDLGDHKYEDLTAELSGWFSFSYLGMEALGKLCFGLMKLFLHPVVICIVYLAAAVVAAGLVTTIRPLQSKKKASPLAQRLLAVAAMWADPLLWLISPTNLANGFSTAFLNGFINKAYTKPELHEVAVGYLGTITSIASAVFGHTVGHMSIKTGKFPMIFIGALAFAGLPMSILFFGCCQTWHEWLILLYVFGGLGRGVYESVNRAAWADFYQDNTEEAFANFTLFANMSYAISFFMQADVQQVPMSIIILVLSVLIPFGYMGAMYIDAGRQDLKKGA